MPQRSALLTIGWLLAAAVCNFLHAQNAPVYVDNYSGRNIQLQLNGMAWGQLNANASRKDSLPVGEYELLLYEVETSRQLDSMKVVVEADKVYIFNLLGGISYHILSEGIFYRWNLLVSERLDQEDLPAETSSIIKGYRRTPMDMMFSWCENTGGPFKLEELRDRKMEVLPLKERDRIFDIVRNDSVCYYLDTINGILENPLTILEGKCPGEVPLHDTNAMESWFVAINRINAVVLDRFMPIRVSEAQEQELAQLRNRNDFDGYFQALRTIDPQDTELVALQARYHRLRQMQANMSDDKKYTLLRSFLQVRENLIRHGYGFSTKPLKRRW